MNAEERAYADAWLREMWPTVYEYVPPRPQRSEKAVDRPRKKAS